jgi:hypothetical protein
MIQNFEEISEITVIKNIKVVTGNLHHEIPM